MKIYNTLFMGNPDNGSRHGGLKTAALATILALAGCSKAEAADKANSPEIVPTKVAALVETETVTRAECLALEIKSKKIACMRQLSAQRKAEITALDKGLQADTETIATNEQGLEEQRTTVDVLMKEIEDRALDQEPTR